MPYKDPEVARRKHRERYLAKREHVLALSKKYYETHKEQQSKNRKLWYANNHDKMLGYAAKWRATHPEKNIARNRDYKERMRVQVFEHYGNRCQCCGDDHREFFALDHVHGGGNKHRREENIRGGGDMFLWIIRHNFPDSIRILCHNCNMARGFYGYCPHEKESEYGISVAC